jgi:hypothetical protein
MNLLWAGEARVDLSRPIGESSRLSARLRVAA